MTLIDPVAWRDDATLLRVRLLTGRTHQIRVHLASIAHPLLGDWLYGESNDQRPMLHSMEVEMTHPATDAPLVVTCPLPGDFLDLYPDGDALFVAQ